MDVAYSNAERLVRTELNAVENRASAEAIRTAEFTHYQFMATLDRRTCARCGERDDEVYKLSEMNQGENAPPMHARCRCTIVAYLDGVGKGERVAGRERLPEDVTYKQWRASLTAPSASDKVSTDALTAPPSRGNVTGKVVLTSPPQAVGKCKNFGELKIYWAENYNVKVDDSIAKLHFGSVQAAMNGVESVLNEFPPAMRFLKEFSTRSEGLMTTSRGRGIIYFDPKSFSDVDNIISEIQAGIEKGFYPKNMSVSGVGAHEAGHIVEDWLIDKSGAPKDVNLRIVPRRIVSEAYASALKTIRASGRFKTSKELIGEICTHALKYNESECVADAIADYKINKENAALMSRNIWQRLKKELE